MASLFFYEKIKYNIKNKKRGIVMESFELKIESKRNTEIPCTVVLPDKGGNLPLVLMAHGFCATRHENGAFTMLAEKLAEAGIASIRCDFPGCNDSTESHEFNNLENNMDNLDSLLEYMKEYCDIDEFRVGMVGYSMGGKVVLHYTKRHPEIGVMGLWAPAAMNGLETGSDSDLGDPVKTSAWYEIAQRDGVYMYHNSFDERILPLGKDFFEQVINSKAQDYFSAYDGHVILVNGDDDQIIPASLLQKVADCAHPDADFVHHVVKGANHGFGAWTNEPHQMEELVNVTADFIIRNI